METMDLTQLASDMGIARDDLADMLTILESDVQGDATITDGHPRFGEHIALIGWAQITWEDIDARGDAAQTDAELNPIARDVIARIRQGL